MKIEDYGWHITIYILNQKEPIIMPSFKYDTLPRVYLNDLLKIHLKDNKPRGSSFVVDFSKSGTLTEGYSKNALIHMPYWTLAYFIKRNFDQHLRGSV